jgi:osmoprotectant transport system ATP-binding protein
MTEPSQSTVAIEFTRTSCRIDGRRLVISDLSLAIRTGETLVLLGRSGSGKTSALKLINRLLTPSEGQIRIEGKPTVDWDVIRLRRRIGYAIQEVGLFPHYTVEQNISVLPKLEKWPKERIAARVNELLGLVSLPAPEFRSRYPHELSGGQRQRVGLARALAIDPPILLMDEPFGALDAITRSDLQLQFKQMQQRLGKTVVFVTHDVSEALLLADRIALLEDGLLRGTYTPAEFSSAQDPYVKPYMTLFRAGERYSAG